MTPARTAIIIGAGIAGPATAMALHKAGIESTVYESHPATAEAAGVFLTLGSNGIAALRLLDADRQAVAAGISTPRLTMRSGTGKLLGHSSISQPLADGTTSQTIKRGDLYQILREAAIARGIRFVHGKRFVDARESAGKVHAVFADDSQAVADMLIGCDGVGSAVRRVIDPAAPAPRFAGLVNTGGYADEVAVAAGVGEYEMVMGKRGFFGYLPAPDGQVWWFANLPYRTDPGRDRLRATTDAQCRSRLRELFADDAGPALDLIDATSHPLRLDAVHTIPRLPKWRRGAMLVIGDAAHAPSPSSGQGASLSIEDAVIVAKCLQQSTNPAEAFADFETARRKRVEDIIKIAARINNSKAAGPIGRIIRDAVMPLVLKLAAGSKAQRDIYGYRIDWETAPQQPDRGAATTAHSPVANT